MLGSVAISPLSRHVNQSRIIKRCAVRAHTSGRRSQNQSQRATANIMGGRGSAAGGLLGAFLVAMVYNALVLLEVSSFWQNLFVGALILLAVVADTVLHRMRRTA